MTFIDTPGACPGLKAEKHGIGEAIAKVNGKVVVKAELTFAVGDNE